MMELYLLYGILTGLLFGIPAGAVGAMTIQRTLNYNLKAGLLTGLGSSVADCFYAALGAFGLTMVSDFLLNCQTAIHIIGGALVLLMGFMLIWKKSETAYTETRPANGMKMFFSSFAIGITNPTAILTFLFAFSYFKIPASLDFFQSSQLVAGVFIGTYFWWGILSAGVNMMKKKAKNIHMTMINRVSGMILLLFGIAVFVQTLM